MSHPQKGTPLTWAEWLDHLLHRPGALSPVLTEAGADALVADAFSRWTSISTAAIEVQRVGQLGENVSGANVSTSGGVITLPADILPSAMNMPVAIVYDADGAVTDALLGEGASDASSCLTNAAYGGVDNFSADAHLLHALADTERNLRTNFRAGARPGISPGASAGARAGTRLVADERQRFYSQFSDFPG